MESIVTGAASLLRIGLTGIQAQIESKLNEGHVSQDIISSMFRILSNETQHTDVFKELETTYSQMNTLKQIFDMLYKFIFPDITCRISLILNVQCVNVQENLCTMFSSTSHLDRNPLPKYLYT